MSTRNWILTGIGVLVVALLAYYLFSITMMSGLDGAGGVHAPVQTMEQYSSEEGFAFMYPSSYALSSHPGAPGEGDTLVLVPKGITVPQNSDGPESISISVFSNAEGLPLEQFIKNKPVSNYHLTRDGVLTPGMIGGKPSLSYHYSGLYENDAVAVLNNGKVYIFSVGWDRTTYPIKWGQSIYPIRDDFDTLLSSVAFQ